MKITFVLPGTGNSVSGGMRVVYEYANRLKERGHEVNVIYPLIPPIASDLSLKSFRDRTVGALKNLKRGNKISWFHLEARLIRAASISPKLVKLVERGIPDADVVVATAWETAYFVNKLKNSKGEKFYFIQHYEIWNMWYDEELWRKAESLEKDPNKLCLAMHDVVPTDAKLRKIKSLVDETYKMPLTKITISSWLRDLLEVKFKEKVEGVVTNGVNFETFYKQTNNRREKKILMPYRPTKDKGTEDGIKAFVIVKEKHPNVKFVLYGAASKKMVPDWITKCGSVSDNELKELYNSSEIFVLPSWVEGFGLPPMEAMACGCAVVATNVGGIPDYTIAGQTAMVSPPRTPEALAQNIIGLLENEGKLRKIAEAGHKYVQQFTWDRATDQMEQIFLKNQKNLTPLVHPPNADVP
ncbi:MAG: glycosyltransferase family 4 protein [Candidatus Bathyarchaeia archaeon]|jgi:glycosyltransferase involved in cell wall biosynthesis